MKHFNRDASVKCSAGLGLSVLLLSAGFGPSGAHAQNGPLPGSPMIEEPTEDPEVEPAYVETKAEPRTPEAVIRKWPKTARVTAGAMIDKYGEPSRYTKGALVWINNGPWEKTVVYQPQYLGKRRKDFVEQTIARRVPDEKVDELKRFDSRLEVNQSRGELSARSESEHLNFLALNLADEIIAGKRTVDDARDFYLKTELLSKAGKSSPYMESLFPSRSGMNNLPVQ